MNLLLVLILALVVLSLPTWPYSTGWGYYPSGGLGLLLAVLLVLLLTRRRI
jgi:MYXO-CTERM domain-containing protein